MSMRCPRCDATNIEVTTMGNLFVRPHQLDLTNRATCHGCGFQSTAGFFELYCMLADSLGAKDGAPVRMYRVERPE